ncbi:MAG: hypothetical protein L0Z68_04390 [Gammaproteobacteria bacterium]|nr:hypothetical protein [Gammaproteobacteria bacterium]
MARSSPVGTASGWSIQASGKKATIGKQGGRTLGWEPGILDGNEWNLKGMRWRTFERLTAEHDAFAEESLAGVSRRLGIKVEG